MKVIVIILSLLSFKAVACAPKPTRFATVDFFPSPMFSIDLKTNEKTGKIRGKFWISKGGIVQRYEIIEVIPKELPTEPIEKSIKKARFSMHGGFAVQAQEIEITFEIDPGVVMEYDKPKFEPAKIQLTNQGIR